MERIARLASLTLFLALAPIAFGCGGDDDRGGPPGDDAGTMGTDDGGTTGDGDGGDTADAGDGLCPYPEGPYGTNVLSKFEPFTLEQCDGTPYSFHNEDYCMSRLTVISIAAGWCPPCIRESMLLTETITEPYREAGVRVIQILVQKADYTAPDYAFCNDWVSRYGLTNIELLDPIGVTAHYFPGNSLPSTIIVDDEGIIRFRENGATEGLVSLKAKLDELLAEP